MSVLLQKQIKDNSTAVRDYFQDLQNWTEEAHKKEKRRQVVKKAQAGLVTPNDVAALPSNTAPLTKPSSISAQEESAPIKRDQTPIPQYYRDWDQYDAEAEVERIEEEAFQKERVERAQKKLEEDRILDQMAISGVGERTRTSKAKPRVRISVRTSGRRVSPVDLALPKKEAANALFAAGRYLEAVACYSSGLDLLEKYTPPAERQRPASDEAGICDDSVPVVVGDDAGVETQAWELKTAFLANRAAALLKLEEWREAAIDCDEALRFDPSHHKAMLRRGFAFAKMRRWAAASRDLERAVATDPSDKRAAAELSMARRMLAEQRKEQRARAKAIMCDPTRDQTMPTRRLTVKTRREGDNSFALFSGTPASSSRSVVVGGSSATIAVPAAASSAPVETAERKPYVPRSVRMRGQQGSRAHPDDDDPALPKHPFEGNSASEGSSSRMSAGAAAPMNFYTFEAQWARLRSNPAGRLDLLRRVGTRALPSFFRESLDAELMAGIIEVLLAALKPFEAPTAESDTHLFALSTLQALMATPRCDISLQGLSAAERVSCGEVFDHLAASGFVDASALTRLRPAFNPWSHGPPSPSSPRLDELDGLDGIVDHATLDQLGGHNALEGKGAGSSIVVADADDEDDVEEMVVPVVLPAVGDQKGFSFDDCD